MKKMFLIYCFIVAVVVLRLAFCTVTIKAGNHVCATSRQSGALDDSYKFIYIYINVYNSIFPFRLYKIYIVT